MNFQSEFDISSLPVSTAVAYLQSPSDKPSMSSSTSEEYLDALTESGEFIGALPRSKCHREGIWHRVIHLWICNSKGQLILQKRASCKESFPSLWDISVGGHMSAGDDAPTACQREAEEELGIKLGQEELIHIFQTKHSFVLHNGTYKDNELVEVYVLMRDIDLSGVVLQESEVDAVKWMDWREVRAGILDPIPANFVPIHTDYDPLWSYLEGKFPR